MEPEVQQQKQPNNSRVWWFIAASGILLLLFVLNILVFMNSGGRSAGNALSSNVLTSFAIACLCLATTIAANVSAFLNPRSPWIAKIFAPFVIVLFFVITIPFFVSLGLAMVEK